MGRDVTFSQKTLSPGCVGSGYTTVQSAINAAASGDVIEVCPGTYRERLSISGKTLTLRSRDGAATVTIDAQGLGRALNISNNANATVERLTFVNGAAGGGNGGDVSCNASTLALRGSVLRAGRAYKGGGLASSGCSGVVEDNTVEGNFATWSGGGVYISGNGLLTRNNVILRNEADDRGGGLYLNGSSPLLGNTIEENHADVYGGGAFVTLGYGEISGNNVVGNTSVDDGGGIYVDQGKPLVDGNTFELNESEDEGGGLRVKVSEATITNNLFIENHADYRGGGLKVSHDEVVMSGNTYLDNTAYSYGGGAFLYESASVITHETFVGNDADNGGALVIEAGWDNVLIEDCVFESYHSSYRGGLLYIKLPNRTTTLRRVSFTGGRASYGGAIYAINSVVSLENLVLDGNQGYTSGGAMYLDGVTGKVRNTVAYDNFAPVGSALTAANSTTNLKLTNTAFYQNRNSAALHLASGTAPEVKYNDFNGNFADFSGMGSVIGVNGNLNAPPSFVNPAGGDFTLQPTSALINTGDPAILDTNGTRSDIGRFGGPKAY